MPLFDDTFLARLNEAADIRDLVGGYVTLKEKSPGDWWGACPFHDEKTPSFHVLANRGMYYCFGCHRGGGALHFLMEMERVSFYEAVKLLAEKTGIELPRLNDAPGAGQRRDEAERLAAANLVAMDFYHAKLKSPADAGARRALEYLRERGFTDAIVSDYRIGWAPAGWDELLRWCQSRGISGGELERVGLALRKRSGSGFVDRFRARIIFPIQNHFGKPVAFGGRRLEGVTPEEDAAKYVNTSDTALYRKGEHLYGLFTAREAIRRSGYACLVEGYTDLIALVQAGVKNVVASLGTALTPQQVKLIRRFADSVHVVYDGDEAGISAALRAADQLVKEEVSPFFIRLPDGEDPDSVLQKQGAEALNRFLNAPLTLVQFQLATAGFKETMDQAKRLSAARKVLQTIAAVRDPLRREAILLELSDATHLRREALDQALAQLPKAPMPTALVQASDRLRFNAEQIVERDLMRELIAYPQFIGLAQDKLQPSDLSHPALNALYRWMESAYLKGASIHPAAYPGVQDNEGLRSFIAEAVASQREETAAVEAIKTCLHLITKKKVEAQRRELDLQIRQAHRSGQSTRELMEKLAALKR